MKKLTKLLSVCLLASAMAFGTVYATGCNINPSTEDSEKGSDSDTKVEVTNVTLSSAKTTISVGEQLIVVATVTPSDADDKSVTWSSDNEDVATVSSGGVVTGVSAGTVTITALSSNSIAGTRLITVTNEEAPNVAVTGVSLSPATLSLAKGETGSLTATVLPDGASNKNVVWATSDSSVATVSGGTVVAVGAGTAVITVTTEDGNKTDTCTVTVTDTATDPGTEPGPVEVPVSSVTVTPSTATLTAGDTVQLSATVLPTNATDKTVIWTTSDSSVATVVNGLVTASGTVTATKTVTITATSGSQQSSCTITVNPRIDPIVDVTSVTVSGTAALTVGDSVKFTATVLPANATDQTVTWTSSAPTVASVDSSGNVTALAAGSARITATAGGTSGYLDVTVSSATTTEPETPAVNQVTVTFMSDGSEVDSSTVESGSIVSAPNVTKTGYYIVGWYERADLSGNAFNFTTAVTADKTLYAKWAQVDAKLTYTYFGNETAAFEWGEGDIAGATVEYRVTGTTEYTRVDSELVRNLGGGTARVDVLGLKGGFNYDFKITPSSGAEITVENAAISAYDRSGYAHFNYTKGVGAYNDDGSIKSGTLVIYVTESNKNDVLDYAYVDGVKTDISAYMKGSDNTQYTGLGEMLNNRRYDGTDRMNVGIAKLCDVYGSVAIRIIGTVSADVKTDGTSTLVGLTDYSSTGNGGTVGDNGRMARMVNAKNLTVEGVGEDASIFGWGLHFISNDNLHQYNGVGESFEVRNITFESYPEDAIGMEGTQGKKVDSTGTITSGDADTDADLISPVSRCWIHNNSFLPGYCANPAESDKAEGDGSCDFKRGRYYTLSYNYFEYCHKTNLIGSSDSSLQFDISLHHNYWYNCGSRIPLVRNSNIHFYNNYVAADINDSKAELSYVNSLRADSYLFSESNYFEGCKNILRGTAEGGIDKSWNNAYVSCFGITYNNEVTSREQAVTNTCKFVYYNIDYSTFDTNPSLFYYDAVNKKSDCYLTDAVTARSEAIKYAGVLKRDYDIDTTMSKYTPASAISFADGQTEVSVDLTAVAKSTPNVVNNVLFTNITGVSSGTVKGKGQIVTFTLAMNTDVMITGTASNADYYGELVRADGTVIANKFTSYVGTLPAGTYFVATGEMDKEFTISSISFKEGVTDAEKIATAIDAINAIPSTIALTTECKQAIDFATQTYNSLTASLKAQVTNVSKLTSALSQYSQLQVDNVETLIAAIGTVNENSSAKITAARAAYDALTTDQKSQVTNYSTLTAAETAFAGYAVIAVNNAIGALSDVSALTARADLEAALDEYEAVKAQYDALSEEQQAQVTDYAKVTSGIATINNGLKPYEVIDMIADLPAKADVSLTDATRISAARAAYDALTADQKTLVGDVTKLTDAEEAIDELAKNTTVAIFSKEQPELATNAGFTVSGNYKAGVSFEYNGVTYTNPLKLESSTSITFTTAIEMKLTIRIGTPGGQIKVDGTVYTDADNDGFIIIDNLAAGSHTLGKADGDPNLWYVILSPVA